MRNLSRPWARSFAVLRNFVPKVATRDGSRAQALCPLTLPNSLKWRRFRAGTPIRRNSWHDDCFRVLTPILVRQWRTTMSKRTLTHDRLPPLRRPVMSAAVLSSVIVIGSTMALSGCASYSTGAPNQNAAAYNPCNPCNPKAVVNNPCNPCAAKNPCNPCNPCAAKNPCNPCKPRKAVY